jgi:hypothetical protein
MFGSIVQQRVKGGHALTSRNESKAAATKELPFSFPRCQSEAAE